MKKTDALPLAILTGLIFWAARRDARPTRRIGAVFPEIPEFWECHDGTFSTSRTNRACARHGGRKSALPVELGGSNLLNVRDVPLSQIQVNKHLFQGREKDFSERSVTNIVDDVQRGRFLWQNLDPVTLWQDERGQLFLLSGHSRFEAFRRLADAGAVADRKDFLRIPAKILKNVPREVAATVALESNTLSTKETDIERASFYRRLRQDGTPEKDLVARIKKNEGRNWGNIHAYTFLNPNGKMWATLRQFAESEDTSANLTKSMAKWIGAARRELPMLTNAHENELFDWLFNQRGYGTGTGQVSSEIEFKERVAMFVSKNTFFGQFDADKPLNIQKALFKSPAEIEYDRQIEEAKKRLAEAEAAHKQKIRELTARQASPGDIRRIVAPLEINITAARSEVARLIQAKQKVLEYSKNEVSLFGHSKRR